MSEIPTDLIDADELSRRLALKRATVYYKAAKGELPHYRLGKLYRFSESEIANWLAANHAEGESA